nr:unnamed protein product [Callosobruchus analis]
MGPVSLAAADDAAYPYCTLATNFAKCYLKALVNADFSGLYLCQFVIELVVRYLSFVSIWLKTPAMADNLLGSAGTLVSGSKENPTALIKSFTSGSGPVCRQGGIRRQAHHLAFDCGRGYDEL